MTIFDCFVARIRNLRSSRYMVVPDGETMTEFSHLDESGDVRMVDVTDKPKISRSATAQGSITMKPRTVQSIISGDVPKGNVFTAAKLAGIQAAKKTSELIPLCHPLTISWVDIEFTPGDDHIGIEAVAKTQESTGVEMEVLTAVSVAALAIYDMCKAVDKTMAISDIHLVEKRGGKSDHATDFRPGTGVITLSDSVAAGDREDRSGRILKSGFEEAGCAVEHTAVLTDGSDELGPTITSWIDEGVRLIVTTGGTGIGPRDLTIEKVEDLFERRLPGVEQALHAYGHGKVTTAMISRLAAGTIGNTIVVCLPGSPGAVKDALNVLIPTIFHAFPMIEGEGHGEQV